jgi:hypothetical protein
MEFERNMLSFESEIKLMKLLGASEEIINELLEMKTSTEG